MKSIKIFGVIELIILITAMVIFVVQILFDVPFNGYVILSVLLSSVIYGVFAIICLARLGKQAKKEVREEK